MKNVIRILIGMGLSFPIFANSETPIVCKDFRTMEIRESIKTLDQNFKWDNLSCKIVATKSIFPKKDKIGKIQFENGLQIFVYQNDELKFICLSGWICKS